MRRWILLIAPLLALAVLVAVMLWPRRPGPATPGSDGNIPIANGQTQGPESDPKQTTLAADPERAGSIRVIVTGAAGPLADANVRIVRESDRRKFFDKMTSPSGETLFEGVPAGEWIAGARRHGLVPESARVHVDEGQMAEVVLRLAEGGIAQGTVTARDGQPIAGATVQVVDNDRKAELEGSFLAHTDDHGGYLIEGIPLQKVGLRVRAARYRPVERFDLAFTQPGETQTHNFTLDSGTSISGLVIDESGIPIVGATVSAGNEEGRVTVTDSEGHFAIYGLGDSPIGISASAKGFGTEYLRNVPPNSAGLEIRLYRGGRIEGRVNPAIENFKLLFYRFEQDLGKELIVRTETISNSRGGEFAVADVARGVYELSVQAPNYETAARTRVAVNPGETTGGVVIEIRAK